jgi:hypothetical protein
MRTMEDTAPHWAPLREQFQAWTEAVSALDAHTFQIARGGEFSPDVLKQLVASVEAARVRCEAVALELSSQPPA